jgi:hypothetical protein
MIPGAHWIFSDPVAARYAAGKKLAALRSADSSNSRFALRHFSRRSLKLRAQGTPKNLQCALDGIMISPLREK